MKKCILCNEEAFEKMRIPTFGEKVKSFLDWVCPGCEKTILMIRKVRKTQVMQDK